MNNTKEMHTAEYGLFPFAPIVLLRDVLKRWLLILLAALTVGVGSYIFTDMGYTPIYQTNTTFVVTAKGSSTTVYSNLTSANSLATVFTGLLNSSILRKTIQQEMGVSHLDATVTTAVIAETNLITMQVRSSDPRMAFLAAQSIIDNHETLTYEVVDDIVLEVLQYPVVPVSPINSADAGGQMQKTAVLAAFGMAAVMALISFFRDAVRSEKEARSKLDCDCLGEIPHENKYKTLISWLRHRKTSILITNPVTSFHYVETIRKLRRRAEQHMNGGKVLMVTSLLENEGKSTVAVNLALSMAQKHRRVLLIDCDLRKPACHTVLQQKKFNGGVRDVLSNKVSLNDSIVRYQKTNLYLLLERKADQNSGDLLISQRMKELLRWARAEFDFVVLDLPPMSAASDAESMAQLADASMLVVRQNEAVAPALNKAIASLDGAEAKLLGCIVNNVHSTKLFSGQVYGYGGHYQYSRYGNYSSGDDRK